MNPGPESLARHELIGLEVQVALSSNPSQTGLKALVVDETRNTLLLETESKVLRLAKKGTNLVFTLPDGRHVGVFVRLRKCCERFAITFPAARHGFTRN